MQERPTAEKVSNTEAISAAIQLYELVGKISARLGIQATVALFDVPRRVFDDIIDYQNDENDGTIIVHDFQRPVWMKQCAHNVAIYTRQHPEEEEP